MRRHPNDPRLESPVRPGPCRASTIAVLCAAGLSTLPAQEGGVVAELCKDGPACTDDTLEIVFESGTSTYDGPLEAGVEIPVEVVLDTRSLGIQGFSYAVKHDPEQLTLLPGSVTTAGTILDPGSPDSVLGSSWFEATWAVRGGFISAVVLALTEKREVPLGRQVICHATYGVAQEMECTVVRFVDRRIGTQGSPPVALNLTVQGRSTRPRILRHGLVGGGACTETCDDLADNDGDGLADCEDPGCASEMLCTGEEVCDDGIDNNANGYYDCEDRLCAGIAIGCPGPEMCSDGIDNDRDGSADCADSECVIHCLPPRETCHDGTDEDGDAFIDCDDSDCRWDPECHVQETCDDGTDNDWDSLIDCEDRDCAGSVACPWLEVCTDGEDNDADGLLDCADPDCSMEAPCLDCDGDGLPDENQDEPCTAHNDGPALEPSPFIRGDADGNGRIDIIDALVILQVAVGWGHRTSCPIALSTNEDALITLADALPLLRWIFLQGPPLPHPFPGCGTVPEGCYEPSAGC